MIRIRGWWGEEICQDFAIQEGVQCRIEYAEKRSDHLAKEDGDEERGASRIGGWGEEK